MKINLNKPLTDLDGNQINNMTLAKELAVGLSQQSDNPNPLKTWEWCQRLATTGELDLDTQDLEFFKSTIEKARGFTVFFLGQVLQEIAKQKG